MDDQLEMCGTDEVRTICANSEAEEEEDAEEMYAAKRVVTPKSKDEEVVGAVNLTAGKDGHVQAS